MNPTVFVNGWHGGGLEPIVIVGAGARTSVGSSAPATAAAVRGGISGLSIHPEFVDSGGDPVSFAADPFIGPDVSVERRMLDLLRAAAFEALVPEASATRIAPDGCLLALPEPRAGLPVDLGTQLSTDIAVDFGLDARAICVLPHGHAGGLMAMQVAAQWLAEGRYQSLLVAGVDSYHADATIRSLEIHRRLKTRDIRGGFIPGEAASACLLVPEGLAQRAGRSVSTRIRSAATAREPSPLHSKEPSLGEGLTAVIDAVTRHRRLPQDLITSTYCDLNGERLRSEEFVFAMLRTQAAFRDPNVYLSPADCWGDVGAASGPLFAILAMMAERRAYAKGRHTLLWAGSDHGYRAAIALEA